MGTGRVVPAPFLCQFTAGGVQEYTLKLVVADLPPVTARPRPVAIVAVVVIPGENKGGNEKGQEEVEQDGRESHSAETADGIVRVPTARRADPHRGD